MWFSRWFWQWASPDNLCTIAAFHWARKLVFTSFPVGNIVLLKSEMSYFQVGNSEFCEHPDFRLGNTSFRAQRNAAYVCYLCMCGLLLVRILSMSMCVVCEAIWKVIRSWLTAEQRNKTILVSRTEMNKYVSDEQLELHMRRSTPTDQWWWWNKTILVTRAEMNKYVSDNELELHMRRSTPMTNQWWWWNTNSECSRNGLCANVIFYWRHLQNHGCFCFFL